MADSRVELSDLDGYKILCDILTLEESIEGLKKAQFALAVSIRLNDDLKARLVDLLEGPEKDRRLRIKLIRDKILYYGGE